MVKLFDAPMHFIEPRVEGCFGLGTFTPMGQAIKVIAARAGLGAYWEVVIIAIVLLQIVTIGVVIT